MPEGDAVWRTARRLHTALAGQMVLRSDLRVPSLATTDLAGRRTIEVVPRGKHILHRLEGDLTLHSHLRMDGRWRTFRAGAATAKMTNDDHTVRAVLVTDLRSAVGTKLGTLDLVRTSNEASIVGHLGPDLLDPAFDENLAVQNLQSNPERPIAEALLDQRNLAGIGTIWASEPLFIQGLSPWSTVADVGEDHITDLVRMTRRLLVMSCRLGRTTITGRSDNVDDAWVHGRMGLPCKKCGSTIRLAPIGQQPQERVMFYCPSCQGGMSPRDTGVVRTPLGHGRRETC